MENPTRREVLSGITALPFLTTPSFANTIVITESDLQKIINDFKKQVDNEWRDLITILDSTGTLTRYRYHRLRELRRAAKRVYNPESYHIRIRWKKYRQICNPELYNIVHEFLKVVEDELRFNPVTYAKLFKLYGQDLINDYEKYKATLKRKAKYLVDGCE